MLWFLRNVPLLAPLPRGRLEALARRASRRELSRGEFVYRAGDASERVAFVHGGRVKTSRRSRCGKALMIGHFGPGDVVGESSLFDQAPREESAKAVEATLLTEVPSEVLHATLMSSATALAALAALLGRRRRLLEEKLERLVLREAPAKLAAQLLELAADFGSASDDGVQINLRVTQSELAAMIGSARETVSGDLARFERAGLVSRSERRLTLSDLARLERVADGAPVVSAEVLR